MPAEDEQEAPRAFAPPGIVPERYARNLGTLGPGSQRRLQASSAVIVGLGGLGGHVLECLARLGVGRIHGIDGDVIEETNLNRQVLTHVRNLGCPKTQAAADRVALVNPDVRFTAHAVPFQEVDDSVLCGSSVVFDCLDSVAGRLELARRCSAAGVTLIHGAIAGWSGQVAACRPGSGLLGKLYGGGKHGVEDRLGALPFTAAVAGHIMVSLAVLVFLGEPPSGPDKVLMFDLLGQDWQTVEL
jgi:molybdopterin/thiamine biosynthesis adenylyltransferase